MTRWLAAVRFDVLLQARHGFYAATAAIVVLLGALLLSIPAAARTRSDLWVPFLIVVNLPITTFFFVCGLILLERDEGTLLALGVSPVTAGQYLAMRMTTLVALALVETLVIVSFGFSIETPALLIPGAVLLGVMLTGFGAGVSSRYTTVN
jgi:fluoroquinolone transport system permease protein